MMTSDFNLARNTLTGSAGPELRGSVRIWNYKKRRLVSTINLGSPNGGPALGTMDVKMLPKDPTGISYTARMFDDQIYAIDPITGTGIAALAMATVTPPD